ncbi:lytic transglycosylase [Rhodococcus sp. WMMA185]|uniref:bifunctional lysozyme/C40 family peptidase n=1 Tax=Rhodococcus sp. WMMA185 TaxID=679318 RepID=UPI0008784806|nr:C40 family peptidase [Rhodococcus sp. WMMA185]AOW91898.1 lytic transglycosylase [Rhodococcus sp. WMMA185]
MSVDAAAIVVAITTAAGALVQGADLPQLLKDQVAEAIQGVEQASPDIQTQVDDALAALPEPAREQAEQMVSQASEIVKQITDPYIPDPPSIEAAPPVETPEPPDIALDPPPVPRTTGAEPAIGGLAVLPGLAGGVSGLGGLIPPVPAGFPGVSLAPIGAVAVFAPWIRKAGSLCEGIGPQTLAALYSVENDFRYGPTSPVSPAGARGPGQFMPDTWAKYGKDADDDGKADINGVADPMMTSGQMLCDLYDQVDGWKREGVVEGDTLDLTIAAYKAGAAAVRTSRGMPDGMFDGEHETGPYVARIRSLEDAFARMLSPFFYGGAVGDTSRVVEAAMQFVGLPYVWGGGNINGPSDGGFDCSGLTSFAVYAATGLTLPRTSETQWGIGVEVPLSQARPGDLLFGNWQEAGPGHVAIYVGNGQMLHAPDRGDVVRISSVYSDMKVRRLF